MKKIINCKKCNALYEMTPEKKKCVNLGCTEYNKKLRRYDASRQKRKKEKIQFQEEE